MTPKEAQRGLPRELWVSLEGASPVRAGNVWNAWDYPVTSEHCLYVPKSELAAAEEMIAKLGAALCWILDNAESGTMPDFSEHAYRTADKALAELAEWRINGG